MAAGRTEQDTRSTGPRLNRRVLGLRLLPVSGVLLGMDLLFLPWHHFSLDLDQFGVGLGGAVTIDRTGVEAPKGALGISALVLALLLVAYAALDPLVRHRFAAHQRLAWDRFPLLAGPIVLLVLILKLLFNSEFLGLGAWLGVLLAGVLAYAGFTIGQESLLPTGETATGPPPAAPPRPQRPVPSARPAAGRGAPRAETRRDLPETRPAPAARAGSRRLTDQQRRWLLFGIVIIGTTLAIPWLTSDEDETPDPALSATTAAAGSDAAGAQGPAASPRPTTAPRGETSVEPSTVEPGAEVTVGATGAVPDAPYRLRLAREAATCPSGTPLGAARIANQDGEIAPETAVLPSDAAPGRHFLCFVQSGDPSSHTRAVELFVP